MEPNDEELSSLTPASKDEPMCGSCVSCVSIATATGNAAEYLQQAFDPGYNN